MINIKSSYYKLRHPFVLFNLRSKEKHNKNSADFILFYIIHPIKRLTQYHRTNKHFHIYLQFTTLNTITHHDRLLLPYERQIKPYV